VFGWFDIHMQRATSLSERRPAGAPPAHAHRRLPARPRGAAPACLMPLHAGGGRRRRPASRGRGGVLPPAPGGGRQTLFNKEFHGGRHPRTRTAVCPPAPAALLLHASCRCTRAAGDGGGLRRAGGRGPAHPAPGAAWVAGRAPGAQAGRTPQLARLPRARCAHGARPLAALLRHGRAARLLAGGAGRGSGAGGEERGGRGSINFPPPLHPAPPSTRCAAVCGAHGSQRVPVGGWAVGSGGVCVPGQGGGGGVAWRVGGATRWEG
jgi:hypothetical protein